MEGSELQKLNIKCMKIYVVRSFKNIILYYKIRSKEGILNWHDLWNCNLNLLMC